MSLAKRLRDALDANGGASVEFAHGQYRLSLNPIEDRFHELGFILWQEDDRGPVPVASGRAIGDAIVVDDAGSFGGRSNLERVLDELASMPPASAADPNDPDAAVPTGA